MATQTSLVSRKLTEALVPAKLVIQNDSAKHASHAAMREPGSGGGETHFKCASSMVAHSPRCSHGYKNGTWCQLNLASGFMMRRESTTAQLLRWGTSP
jgi:BolA-like protein